MGVYFHCGEIRLANRVRLPVNSVDDSFYSGVAIARTQQLAKDEENTVSIIKESRYGFGVFGLHGRLLVSRVHPIAARRRKFLNQDNETQWTVEFDWRLENPSGEVAFEIQHSDDWLPTIMADPFATQQYWVYADWTEDRGIDGMPARLFAERIDDLIAGNTSRIAYARIPKDNDWWESWGQWKSEAKTDVVVILQSGHHFSAIPAAWHQMDPPHTYHKVEPEHFQRITKREALALLREAK